MRSEGRRLHGFTVVSRTLRIARQLLLPAVIGGASAGESFPEILRWGFIILAVPSVVAAFAQWLVFRFRLQGDELVIDSGVFSRRRRVIPLGRVQNIDVEQSALERLARVAELRLETASGGRDTEASLTVLSLDEAHELQAELLRRRSTAQAEHAALGAPPAPVESVDGRADAAGPEPRRLLKLSPSDLAIAGATSNEAGLIAAGLATLLEVGDDFGSLDWLGSTVEELFRQGVGFGLIGAALAGVILAAAFFVFGWLVSIVATVVRFNGFTLTRAGDDLRREYGLLSRHRSTVPLERVQAVRIEESLLRRPLGLASLKIETAGAGPQQRQNRAGGRAEAFVPIARRRDIGRLLAEVFEDARFDGVRFHGVAPVSRRRGFIRLALPISLAAAVLGLWLDQGWIALLALLLPAWLFATAQYRARGWSRTPGYTLARGGVFNRITWVVPERKIQTLHLRETPFQRRHGVATLMVDTAAGGRVAHVTDLYRDTGLDLLAGLARDGETARRAAVRSSRGG